MNIPIYDVVLDEGSLGLTAVSLVDRPATEENFLYFKKVEQEQPLWLSSNDKRELVGPLLIPGQLILRQAEDGSYYYIRWSKATIRKAAEMFLLNGWMNNVSINHPTLDNPDMKYEDTLEKGVYLLRLWICEGENDDARVKYNLDLPDGSLCAHYKVQNRKIWQRIKSNELRGFSIEAYCGLQRADGEQINSQNNTMMSKFDFNKKELSLFRKLVMFLNEVSEDASDIADIAKKDEAESGEVSLKYWINDQEYIEVDAEGFVRDTEGNLVAEGKYALADNSFLIVDQNNKFVETMAGTDENIDEDEKPVEAPIAEAKVDNEKKEDEDEEDDEKTEGEDDGEDPEASDAPVPVDIEAPGEAGEPEPASTLAPFDINGEEFLLPQPVIDYIKTLLGQNDEQMREVQMLKSRIPSAEPIPTVGNGEKKGESNDFQGLSSIIRLMNSKKR